jgi:hypothetical protein
LLPFSSLHQTQSLLSHNANVLFNAMLLCRLPEVMPQCWLTRVSCCWASWLQPPTFFNTQRLFWLLLRLQLQLQPSPQRPLLCHQSLVLCSQLGAILLRLWRNFIASQLHRTACQVHRAAAD